MTSPLLIEASRLFDGTAPQPTARLLLEGELIREVGGAAPDGVERLRFDDATIMPGLIDAHVHLCFDASPDPAERLAERDDEAALAQMADAAADALGAQRVTGRLAAGLRADVLVVDGDPLADPGALRRARAVFKSGRLIR
jgi:imidazolonepropionase-like amidohydrolase